MLELDTFHRAKNPLGPGLSARLRWAAADALGSPFGKATAEADLRRAGVTAKPGDTAGLAADVRFILDFPRKPASTCSTATIARARRSSPPPSG